MTIVGRSPPMGKRSAHRVCHRTPGKPSRESSNVGGRPVQPDLPPMQGFGEAHAAEPNSIKRHDVRRDDHIDIEAGVLETDRNVRALDQEPIALPWPATEVELNHRAAFPYADVSRYSVCLPREASRRSSTPAC